MNSNSILTSNLLDIIFENRNKEYGAYVLRRDYNKRLLISLMSMFALAAMFAVWQMQKSKPSIIRLIQPVFTESKILPPPVMEKKIETPKTVSAHIKSASAPDAPPIIVEDKVVLKIPPTNLQLQTSVPGDYKDGPPGEGPTGDAGSKGGKVITDVIATLPAPPKNVIDASPEIPAQYPGGINEFIKFLKRNLRSPQDIEEEATIMVKVKFIVSVNGDLLGFNIMETGGEAFDNEVIRVLKKMPKWIPGKSRGENVSSYYTIPVRFTAEK